MRKLFYFAILGIVLAGLLTGCSGCGEQKKTDDESASKYEQQSPMFDADSAMQFVADQCAFGPRVINSAAHDSCANYLANQFERLGAKVTLQEADLKLYDGTKVAACNIIASYRPDLTTRVMLCAHWDSRPWADQDEQEEMQRTPIDGANDGASGVAVLLEVARQIQQQMPDVGVDLICFDAEDCGTPTWDKKSEDSDNSNTWCLGSQYWSQNLHKEGYKARFGLLLDMVGGINTVMRKEVFSMREVPSLVNRVWTTGQLLGFGNVFQNEIGGGVTDDHLQVMRAGIPCIDIIGSDREQGSFSTTWHTQNDNLKNIDREVLRAVGQTVLEIIYTER